MDTRLLWGTVDMLILDVVSRGPNYGYQITQTVLAESNGQFELKEGSLYPALHRLERRKLLSADWGKSEGGRRRKYYKITASGMKTLEAKREEWRDFSAGVEGVLRSQRGFV